LTRGRPAWPEARALTPHDPVFLPLFGGLVALAWILLAAWGLSPWAPYLDHDWTRLGLLASLCRADTAGPLLAGLAIGAFAWLLMSAAMMLPSTLTLIAAFRGLAARQRTAAGSSLCCSRDICSPGSASAFSPMAWGWRWRPWRCARAGWC
jgi:Predicted metal-binding integral membrane protein (DUF2182).